MRRKLKKSRGWRRAAGEPKARVAEGHRHPNFDELGAVTDPDMLMSVQRDQAPLAPAGTPAALVRARSIEDVQRTLAFATRHGLAVVTRGAGTGLAGGANAIDGCIVLSVAGMDRILAIDPALRLATVEPGVLNATLATAAAAQGLYYAPDPASRAISTIGGNIATNAGGSCCLKYGVTGDHVAALKVVLADGSLITTGARTRKNVAGLDLTRLLVGSEGTLGVVVEATVRLLRQPRSPSTLVAWFDDLPAAGRAVLAMTARTELSLCEIMDRTTIAAVDQLTNMGLDRTAQAFVLAQCDSPDAPAAIADCAALIADARDVMTTDDRNEGDQLLAARRAALPALEKLGRTLLDDVAVPIVALPEMLARIPAIAERHRVTIGTFGHAGDGNLHPTIVFRHDEEARAMAAFDEIVRAALALGGTVSGEHGIGTLKIPYLSQQLGSSERALMQRIKAAFDPQSILNPGKAI
ncbi:MAG: FAD-linked oxidase C-terminal domain-containing protein [Kofleriaceae bacterium]